jgi:hypothetical protein
MGGCGLSYVSMLLVHAVCLGSHADQYNAFIRLHAVSARILNLMAGVAGCAERTPLCRAPDVSVGSIHVAALLAVANSGYCMERPATGFCREMCLLAPGREAAAGKGDLSSSKFIVLLDNATMNPLFWWEEWTAMTIMADRSCR